MAKVPLVPDNALLRYFIKSIEEPDNPGPTIAFVTVHFRRPEFQIWIESTMLRDAAKLALDADLQYQCYVGKRTWFTRLFPKVKARIKHLVTERDRFYEDYEFLRKLVAGDNLSITLRKTI
jgi:hypothetical protein